MNLVSAAADWPQPALGVGGTCSTNASKQYQWAAYQYTTKPGDNFFLVQTGFPGGSKYVIISVYRGANTATPPTTCTTSWVGTFDAAEDPVLVLEPEGGQVYTIVVGPDSDTTPLAPAMTQLYIMSGYYSTPSPSGPITQGGPTAANQPSGGTSNANMLLPSVISFIVVAFFFVASLFK